MMSIGMHCRLLGRPGRITALQRFSGPHRQHDKVWVAAASTSPAIGRSSTPHRLYEQIRPLALIQ
jgi:hypothetical protein